MLRQLVGLGRHRDGRLVHDVVLAVGHHFLRHVDVRDGGIGCSQVLERHAQVVDGVVQTVLVSAEGRPLGRDPVDRHVYVRQTHQRIGMLAALIFNGLAFSEKMDRIMRKRLSFQGCEGNFVFLGKFGF